VQGCGGAAPPTVKFTLAINLKTATALGITVPEREATSAR